MSAESNSGEDVSRRELLDTTEEKSVDVTRAKPQRRNFLRGAVASVAAALGFSTSAAAERVPDHAALRPYASETGVRAAFADHEDLLAQLSEDGFLERASADAIEVEVRGQKIDVDAHDHGVRLDVNEINGETVPEIEFVRQTDEGQLHVKVYPDHDHRYAAFVYDDERETELYGDGSIVPELDPGVEDCTWDDCCNCCYDGCGCYCGSVSCCGGYCCY